MVPRENLGPRPHRSRLPLLSAFGLAAGLIALALLPLEAFACTTTITTKLSATSITVGGTVHDSATLTGATSDAGGHVTYTVYSDAECVNVAQSDQPKTVLNGIVPPSSDRSFTSPGTVYWQAAYSGDESNGKVTSACVEEPLVITKAVDAGSTQATPDKGVVGTNGTFGDRATISSAFQPTGDVRFDLYSDAALTSAVIGVSGIGPITDGVASFSTNWTPPAAGTYYWKASYIGDANNIGFTERNSANETITVTDAPADGTPGTVTTTPAGGVQAAATTVPRLPSAGHPANGVALPSTGIDLARQVSIPLLLVLAGSIVIGATVIFAKSGQVQL